MINHIPRLPAGHFAVALKPDGLRGVKIFGQTRISGIPVNRTHHVATMINTSLGSWKQTLVDYVRSGEPDLTNRQMALLLVVYLNPGPHTVRGLARCLNVSKPVVTRALNRLGSLGYLRRQRDDSDKRNIFVARTSEGAEFLEEFGQFLGDAEQPERERLSA